MLDHKVGKFITIFLILSIGPIIYNVVANYMNSNYALSIKSCNFIGILCLASYYIGVIVTIILRKKL